MKQIALIATLLVFSSIIGMANASLEAPFEIKAKGIQVTDYELDYNDIIISLKVNVIEDSGSLQITFEREFFNSSYNEDDDEFAIIADGNAVPYTEIITNQDTRKIMFNLNSGIDLVEIFGTHMKGIVSENDKLELVIDEQSQIINQFTEEKSQLVEENNQLEEKINQLEEEKQLLEEENKILDKRIFELENLVDAMGEKINDLNDIITEQINTIIKWIPFPQ